MPVRLGTPQHVSGLADVVANPLQSTGVGLLIYGSRRDGARNSSSAGASAVGGLWNRVSTWFKGEF
jgi:cell division protein FtsA